MVSEELVCLFSHETRSNQKDKKTMDFLRELYRQTNHDLKLLWVVLIVKTKADLPKFYRQETGRDNQLKTSSYNIIKKISPSYWQNQISLEDNQLIVAINKFS